MHMRVVKIKKNTLVSVRTVFLKDSSSFLWDLFFFFFFFLKRVIILSVRRKISTIIASIFTYVEMTFFNISRGVCVMYQNV